MSRAAAAGAMVAAVLLAGITLGAAAVPAPALTLRRTAPMRGLKRLQKLDRVRLAKRNGVGEFALLDLPGIYYINMKLGSPSKEYSLQFDTGSDLMCVSCSSCTSCPVKNNLGIPLEFYNPNNSSTSSNISCSDYRCKDAIKEGYSVCQTSDSPNNQCGYSMTYADTATSGYYVSDTMYFDIFIAKPNDQAARSSASVLFGCSNSRSEGLQADGVVGFGKNAPSIILQLNSQGVSPKAFSHCLTSSENGGSILVLGEVVEPGLVFTPLVQSQARYNLNMKSIAVNAKMIPVNSSLFTTSNTQGTFVDSGTSLSYLADGVYNPVINAIDNAVPESIPAYFFHGHLCYIVFPTSDLSLLFPVLTLHFEGGAPMTVGPWNYLLHTGESANPHDEYIWCIGFRRSKELEGFEHITILGDLVLRDKIYVYDLEESRPVGLGRLQLIYYINMKLGSPSKEYSLQFDTGSDLMCVSCSSCTSCPVKNNLGIPLEFYNPNNSSTSANISCSDYRCKDAIKEGYSVCQTSDSPNNQCGYSMTYADTATSGYYVSDTMYFDTVIAKSNDQAASSSASVLFGCSNSRSEDLQGDGVVGFGKNAPSIILQLNSQGVSSKAFSHCLTSSEDGGSILLLGEVVAPGFAFTPLILSQPRYNLNMTHIDVNGHKVLINSSFFTTSNTQGTFVDSGTSLAYIADGVYDPLIRAIDDAVPRSIHSFLFNGTICYRSSSSNISLFPRVTMYFEGGAPMTVGPKNYLLLKGYYDNLEKEVLCIGFLRSKDLESYEHITILGDLVLHDKIVVYDLEKMRLGWVNYNCSLLSKTPNIVLSGSLRPHVPSYSSGLIAIGVALFNTVIVASRQLDNYWGWRRK